MQVNRFSVPFAKMGLNLLKFAPAKGFYQHFRRMLCDKFLQRIPDSVLDRINNRYLGEKLRYRRITLINEDRIAIYMNVDLKRPSTTLYEKSTCRFD